MACTNRTMPHAGLFVLLILFHSNPMANDETVMAPLWSLSLEELLKVQITTLASNRASSIREQPAVVSIVTDHDIQQAGARDLIDVLRLIPGFDLQFDIASFIGMTFRGIWAADGRILLLIDDMDYTDLLFGLIPFGQHFAVNQIEKIEIIRGPGTAKYGGNAQLAVIKITTKGKYLNGLETIVSSGIMGSSSAFNSVTVNGAKPLDQGFIKASLAASKSPHSTQKYFDFYGGEFDQEKDSKRSMQNINMGGEYQDLSFQLIFDRFKVENQDWFGIVVGNIQSKFDSDMARLEYPWQVNDELTLIASVDYLHQNNWHMQANEDLSPVLGISDVPLQLEVTLDRYQLQTLYQARSSLSINAGVMHQQESAHAKETTPGTGTPDASVFFNGSNRDSYQTQAAFFQADWSKNNINWSVGGRYSDHSLVGKSWVPRISYVQSWKKWHVKGLYSRSFREPEFFIISVAEENLKPETAKTSEVEVGYLVSPHALLALNVFHAHIEDPIIYSVVDSDLGLTASDYRNQADLSSAGLEASWHWQPKWGQVKMGYSYYEAIDNPIPEFQVSGKGDVFLAAASHKITLDSRYQVNSRLSLNPSAIWTSPRYGYDYDPSVVANPGDPQKSLQKFNSELTLNVFMNYKTESLTLGAGVFDVLDIQHQYIQPYDGGGAPLPGPGRMLYMKLTYTL